MHLKKIFIRLRALFAFILCNFHVYKLENAYIKDLYASRVLMNFYTPDLSGRIMVWRGRLSICLCLSVRLSTKLVDMIQTEPFKLGPSNLVH